MAERIINSTDLERTQTLFDCAQIALEKGAYAMRVCGDAGLPVVRNGQYIVVEPRLTAAPTDRVVVVLKDGNTMLQELLVDTPESITVATLDGATRLTIQRDELRPEFGVQLVTSFASRVTL